MRGNLGGTRGTWERGQNGLICARYGQQRQGSAAVQIGGYRAWPTELRFTLSGCSAKLREILCSWPGVAIGS